MAKVVYETPDIRYEVQRATPYEEKTAYLDGWVDRKTVTRWEPIGRYDSLIDAKSEAEVLQRMHTLDMYRVVDRFAEEDSNETE